MSARRLKGIVVWSVLGVCLLAGNTFADTILGSNITISDEFYGNPLGWGGDWNLWWTNQNEDQEVEPSCYYGQVWDLEAFFLNNTTLTLVSGWNLKDGLLWSGYTYRSGDIFIDTTGDVKYGALSHKNPTSHSPGTTSDTFGYDYVIDVDWTAGGYSVYDASGLLIMTVDEGQNWPSSPWTRVSGGNPIPIGGAGTVNYTTYETDAAVYAVGGENLQGGTLLGGTHYAASVDLGWLKDKGVTEFTTHFTIECGNDGIMGQMANGAWPSSASPGPVPEPSTLVLLGFALMGVIFRKRVFG
jgi:hypothetical protein